MDKAKNLVTAGEGKKSEFSTEGEGVNHDEDSTLQYLHGILIEKQRSQNESIDDTDEDSLSSVDVITDSAGTVSQIRELYSHSVPNIDQGGSKEASHLTALDTPAEIIQPEKQNKSVSHFNTPVHLREVLHQHVHQDQQHDQVQLSASKDKHENAKKRKVISDSEKSPDHADGEKSVLYPVFRKVNEVRDQKETCAKGDKDKKEGGRRKRSKSRKADKYPMEEEEGITGPNADIVGMLDFSEETLQKIDVHTIVDFNHRVKNCIQQLQNKQDKDITEYKKLF